MDPRQSLGAKLDLIARQPAAERLDQHVAGALADAAGVVVARHIDEHRDEAPERVGAREQFGAGPILQRQQPDAIDFSRSGDASNSSSRGKPSSTWTSALPVWPPLAKPSASMTSPTLRRSSGTWRGLVASADDVNSPTKRVSLITRPAWSKPLTAIRSALTRRWTVETAPALVISSGSGELRTRRNCGGVRALSPSHNG